MTGDITITQKAVTEAAGCDPWELKDDFSRETDPAMVEELSVIFKNGADEAQDSGSVADYASSLEESAGQRGVQVIYEDAAEHLEQTYDDLGEAGLREVSKTLGEIRDEIEEVQDYLKESISGQIGLDYWVSWHESQANEELEGVREKQEELATTPGGGTLTYSGHGETRTGTASDFPMGEVMEIIERAWTKRAGEFTADTYDRMKEAVDDYYGFLSNREQRLSEEGYDTGDSPVNVWFSRSRAEYEAEQLALELEKPDPDPAAVARYTAGLDNIMNGMLDENGQIIPGGEQLSDEELAFLTEFYDTLGTDGLTTLGNLGADPNRDGPAAVEAVQNAQRAAANGINIMTNPEVGGLDTNQPAHFDRLPEPIAALVRDPQENLNRPFEEQIEHYRDFDSFGDLMGHATAAAGTGFSTDLAHAALWAETGFAQVRDSPEGTNLDMSGASNALRSVALNDVAAASLINDDTFRDHMLRTDWQDDTGAGALIRAATLPAEGDAPRTDQQQAAYELLTSIAEDREELALLKDLEGKGYGANGIGIQSAVTDVTLGYLDYLDEVSNRTGENGGDTVSYFNRGDDTLFRLSADDRGSLFQYVAGSEQEVVNQWETGLNRYYTVRAEEAFASGVSESERNVILGNLGALEGAVSGVYDQMLVDDQKTEDEKKALRAKLAVAAATAVTGAGGAVVTGATATTSWALASTAVGTTGGLVQTQSEAQALADRLNYNADVHGDWSLRSTVAEAALAAGHGSSRTDLAAFYESAGRTPSDGTYFDGDGNPIVPDVDDPRLGDVLDTVETSYPDATRLIDRDYGDHRNDAN